MIFQGINSRAMTLDNCRGVIHIVVYVWNCTVDDIEVCNDGMRLLERGLNWEPEVLGLRLC